MKLHKEAEPGTAPEAEYFLPMHLLGGFALELFLKAWLLLAGRPSAEVRAYKHKVDELYAEAKRANLPMVHALDDVVVLFAVPHEELRYRYLEPGMLQTADWNNVLPVLDKLAREIHRVVVPKAYD